MAKYYVTQDITITYAKVIEANSKDEAFQIASDIDLDDWKEVDVNSCDSMYIAEMERDNA
jgi:hypothetical protein